MSVATPRFLKVSAAGLLLPAGSTEHHVAVYDTLQQLTFTAAPLKDGERLTWKQAEKAATALDLCGRKGEWRLPSRMELLQIIDHDRAYPAVDPEFFTGPYDWTWTSTLWAGSSDGAWVVSFVYGHSGWNGRSTDGHVRAVCSGQWPRSSDKEAA